MELHHTNLQLNGPFMMVPAFLADGKWTSEERREARQVPSQTKLTLKLVTDTMTDLRETAEKVIERLTGTAER